MQRELEKNVISRLPPSLQEISEMSKNITDDIQNNVKKLEDGFNQLSRNLTDEFETSMKNFHLPNLEELSELSQNVSKDIQSNLNELSMLSKNASSSLHYIARNVSVDVENRLREVAEMPQVVILAKISKNFTSSLGNFLSTNADRLSKYSRNVTENVIFPTIENLSILSQNFTNDLEMNIRNMKLPDVNDIVKKFENFTSIFEVSPKLSDNIINKISSSEDEHNMTKHTKTPIEVMQDTMDSIMHPMKSIKRLVDRFKIQSTTSVEEQEEFTASDNIIDVGSATMDKESLRFPSPTKTIVTLLNTIKTLIRNIAENQDEIAMAFKALPTLMPYILEANTPSLEMFLKEGSQFSIKDLSSIHSALINFHNFVSDTQDSIDKRKAPSFHKLAELIKQRNLGLLQSILQLMLRADGRGEDEKSGNVILNKKDIINIEKNLISPKEFYQVLFEPKSNSTIFQDRKFEHILV